MNSISYPMKKFLFSLFVAVLLVACDKEVVPVLGAVSVTIDEATPEVIQCSVDVMEGTIADCGFYYDTKKNSVSNGKSKKVVGVCDGSVIRGQITGLAPNTTYYIMAYGMNEKGIANSELLQVKTAARIPTADDNKYPGTSE